MLIESARLRQRTAVGDVKYLCDSRKTFGPGVVSAGRWEGRKVGRVTSPASFPSVSRLEPPLGVGGAREIQSYTISNWPARCRIVEGNGRGLGRRNAATQWVGIDVKLRAEKTKGRTWGKKWWRRRSNEREGKQLVGSIELLVALDPRRRCSGLDMRGWSEIGLLEAASLLAGGPA